MREIADRATAALERANRKAKAIEAEIKLKAKQVKKVDDEAERARLDAEATFDEAERRMSASLAREGARQALKSYDLRESAIRKAQECAVEHAHQQNGLCC